MSSGDWNTANTSSNAYKTATPWMKRQNKGCGRRNTESLKLVIAYLQHGSQREAAACSTTYSRKQTAEALMPSSALAPEDRSMLPKALWKRMARNNKIIVTECGCKNNSVTLYRRGGETAYNSEPETESGLSCRVHRTGRRRSQIC